MITRSSSRSARRAATLAALALAIPLAVATPAQAASAAPQTASAAGCANGSRDIDATGARDVASALLTSGTQGTSKIVLRSKDDGNCHWALIVGYGQVWLQTSSAMNGVSDSFVYDEKNERDGPKHTAAFVSSGHYVRACGNPFIGEIDESSGWSAGITMNGKWPAPEVKIDSSNRKTIKYGDGTVCTDWHSPDVFTTGF